MVHHHLVVGRHQDIELHGVDPQLHRPGKGRKAVFGGQAGSAAVGNIVQATSDAANDIDPDDGTDCGAPIDCCTISLSTTDCGATVSLTADCKVLFTPLPDWCGVCTFTYTVEDEAGCVSNEATVVVTWPGTQGIIQAQGGLPWEWFVCKNPFTFAAFFLFFIASLAEGNRITTMNIPLHSEIEDPLEVGEGGVIRFTCRVR